MRENKSTHLSDSNSSGKKKSWLGTDLRNLNGSLHHFDFANLDPTVADVNINLATYGHDWSDIYHEIGQRLDYFFFDFFYYSHICLSDNMYTDELGEKFLILNHDCAFSNSKEDSRTGEHWKMTDQRWKVPQWEIDIAEGHYYCYNLQLVNLYNHTSLTFACNICNFGFDKAYTPTPHFQDKYGSYKWDNGHILPNNVAYFGVDSSNTNNYFIPSKYFNKIFNYFIKCYCITLDYSFQYIENSHNDYPDKGYWKYCFFDCDKIIDSPEHVHFSEEDWLTEDGNSGHFDRSKVHNLVWDWRQTYSRGDWDACLEYALFSNLYFNKYGRCAWVIAGGAWKNVDHFPYWDSSIYWQIHLSITNIRIIPDYNNIFDKHRDKIDYHPEGFTDYSNFIQLDRQPDYILTSENELYYFYRSSVTFNFYNTDILDQVIMKKVSEGINQTLALNHDYTLTKKAGCYQFLVTFLHDNDLYSRRYYGYKGTKTITFNIRIIPDYDFSQGLNAVTLNYISWDGNNYSPILHSDDYWAVDIYLDRKTISRFYRWLTDGPSTKTKFLSFFNKSIFKNACSLVGNLNLKKSINSFFSEKDLYKCLDKEITHRHDDIFISGLKKSIFFVVKNNNSGHLHFILKKYPWTVLNDGEYNTGHFYDKIVQLD